MPRKIDVARLREKLADRNLVVVSARTGIHVNTIRAIATGVTRAHRPETLQRLRAYLEGRRHVS